MGQYPITAGIFGKAMRAVGKTGTPDGKPAWVFENQTGDLGTLLNSSLIWCGDSGSIDIIPAGTSLSSVSSLSLTSGGAAYTDVTAATTCSNNMAQDLTVAITQNAGVIQSLDIVAAGSGYNVGDIITVTEAGGGAGGAKATITAVNQGVPVVAQSVEFKVVAGSVLPIAVDYVTDFSGDLIEADIVICK